ncbi:unnamed protein product [Choristocarpus tenellus]
MASSHAGDSYNSGGESTQEFGSEEYVYEEEDGEEGQDFLQQMSEFRRGQGEGGAPARVGQDTGVISMPSMSGARTEATRRSVSGNAHTPPPPANEINTGALAAMGIGERSTTAGSRRGVEDGQWSDVSPEDEIKVEEVVRVVESREAGKREVVVDVPPEPDAGPEVTRVLFRLPDGAANLARRFLLRDTVSILFQHVRATVEGANERPFELLASYPPSSLGDKVSETLQEASLQNSTIMMRWM